MKFIINNDTWSINEENNDLLVEIYKKQNKEDKVYYVEGITLYSQNMIILNKEMCKEGQIKTLKHELTHCFIKEYGLYNTPEYTEEMVCDLVASINDFITDTVNKWKELKSKEN